MALIKCSECGKDMSDRAPICPNCGFKNNVMFCPECDKQLSSKASLCPSCGLVFKSVVGNGNDTKGENYGLSIASLICSLLGYTTFIGLILGIIVLNSNKGKNNSAKTMGLISVIISSVVLFIGFLFIVSQ